MVSIEQTAFFERMCDSPLASLVKEMTSSKIGAYIEDTSNVSNIALNLLISVKDEDRVECEKYIGIVSKRKPTKESHWIYDNFVLFSIVTAITKFSLDSSWISNVINLSLSNTVGIDKGIKEALKNILAGNYNSKNDFHQISMNYQFLARDEQFQDEYVNKVFKEHWMKPFPFYEDDFLNLMSLKAIEIAVVKKSLLDSQQDYDLNIFVPGFDRRANLLANGLSWGIVLTLIIGIFYGLVKLNAAETDYPVFVKLIFFLLGLSGAGVLGILGWKKGIDKLIRKTINSFFLFKKIKTSTAVSDMKE